MLQTFYNQKESTSTMTSIKKEIYTRVVAFSNRKSISHVNIATFDESQYSFYRHDIDLFLLKNDLKEYFFLFIFILIDLSF